MTATGWEKRENIVDKVGREGSKGNTVGKRGKQRQQGGEEGEQIQLYAVREELDVNKMRYNKIKICNNGETRTI